MVYLVRHAHAGSQKRWSGSDHDRPLSVRGQQQADGLVEALDEYPVARILTSPRVRCRDTVVPLGHLTEAARRAYCMADNRIAESSTWDEQLLLFLERSGYAVRVEIMRIDGIETRALGEQLGECEPCLISRLPLASDRDRADER